VEEAMKHAFKRKTFGKKLIEHPVIRFKLAQMARQVESAHAWLESITYQMKTLPHSEQNRLLGGPIALLKAHASQVFEFCAREAAQIFGGLAYTRGGQGANHTSPPCRAVAAAFCLLLVSCFAHLLTARIAVCVCVVCVCSHHIPLYLCVMSVILFTKIHLFQKGSLEIACSQHSI